MELPLGRLLGQGGGLVGGLVLGGWDQPDLAVQAAEVRTSRCTRRPRSGGRANRAGHPPSADPVEASSAAPGVDHAAVIGIRVHDASRMHDGPIVTLTASNPLDAWSRVRADGRESAQDNGEGAREPDECRDHPSGDRPENPAR